MSEHVPKVLVIGYSPLLSGGVVNVTETLRKSYPGIMDLHIFHHCYTPKTHALRTFLFSLLNFVLRLGRIRKSYDVLHVIVGSSGDAVRTLPYIWLGKLARIPICVQHHANPEMIKDHFPRFIPLKLVIRTWHSIEAHIFLSKRLLKSFEKVFYKSSGLFVIPNSIPETWLRPDSAGNLESRERGMVFFGRWCWEKGCKDLVEGASELSKLVSCDCYTNTLRPATDGSCNLHPWAPEEKVKSIMRTSKLLVLPSYFEAFPTVLLESCASATPFVASNVGGIPDIALESGAGIIFQAGDVQGMTNAVRELIDNPERWRKMAERGKRWAAELSPERIQNEWRVLYESIAK